MSQQTQIVQSNTVVIIPEELESELARMTLQRIILLEEINRLNHVIQEIHEHLINAESYIEKCEIRLSEFSQKPAQQTVEFRIPAEVEAMIAQLGQ